MRTRVGNPEFDNPVENQLKNLFKLKMLKDLGGTQPEPEPNYTGIQPPFKDLPPEPVQPELPGQINMDVRANQEIPEPPLPETNPFVTGVAPKGATFVGNQGKSQDPGFFRKIYDFFQDQRQEMRGQSPVESQVEPTQQGDTFQKLGNFFRNAYQNSTRDASAELMGMGQNKALNQENRLAALGDAPPSPPQAVTESSPTAPLQVQPNAQQQPGTFTQPGAANQVLAEPNLRSAIEQRFGVKVTPEMQQMLNDYEIAAQSYKQRLDEFDQSLTAQQQQIKQRLANRDLTTQDKILMGIALAAPALAFAVSGNGQAALGALGGGLKGVATTLADREKNIQQDEENLLQLGLSKAEAAKEGLKVAKDSQEFAEKVQKAAPNFEVRSLFEQNGNLINGNLVLETGDPLLPLKGDRIQSPEDLKRFKDKIMPDLESDIAIRNQSDANLDQLERLIKEQIKINSNPGLKTQAGRFLGAVPQYAGVPFNVYDATGQLINSFVPASRDTFIDKDGVEKNISQVYETYRTQQSDLYRKGVKGSNFKSVENHFFQQFPDPFKQGPLAADSTKWNTALTAIQALRDKSNRAVLEDAEAHGVDTTRLKDKIKTSPSQLSKSTEEKDKARAEAAAQQVINSRAK